MRITGKTFQKIRNRAKKIHEARASRDQRRNDERGPYQCIVGLMGEVMAWKASGVGSIDLEIYEDGHQERNFDGDLAPYVHVKTCNLRFKGNSAYDSWIVDMKDPLCTNPAPEDKIILVYADSYNDYAIGEVAGFVNAVDVKDIWKPTKKIPHKVAIYIDDIKGMIHPIENI